MALTETHTIDQVTAQLVPITDENGKPTGETRWDILVRRADRVIKDGEVVALTYHRHVLKPGDPVKDEDENVAAIARAAWRKR